MEISSFNGSKSNFYSTADWESFTKYKLNMPVEMVAISNQRILFNSESKELDTYFLSNSFVNEMHMTLDQDIPCPIFYMADKKNMRKNLHSVIKSLVENIDAV